MANLFGEAEASADAGDDLGDDQANDLGVGDYNDAIDAYDDSKLKPPRHSDYCLGHEAIEARLADLIAKDKLPHAMIFSGLQGIGKATVAYRLARTLLNAPSETEEAAGLFGDEAAQDQDAGDLSIPTDARVFKQVASGGHPDLLSIERRFDDKKNKVKDNVDVTEARRVTPFMRMTASRAGGWRVVIIDDADTMNRNAQNAVLKILEEPPKNAVLVLVCHRLGAMIPTIRSRCRVIPFQPLPFETYRVILRQEHPDLISDDIDLLFAMTGGSVGRALEIIDEEGIAAISTITNLFESFPKWDWPQIHGLSDSMGRGNQNQAYQMFARVMCWITDTLLRHKAYNAPLPIQLKTESIQSMISHYSLNDWIEIARTMSEHFETFDRANLDKRQAVLGSFSIFK